jgi:hypothetical protein
MQEVKVRFQPSDIAALDQQAAAAATTRAQLIRNRALSPALPRLTVSDYHRLVSDATTYMRGDLSHRHVEHLVAYVITRLDQHSRQAVAGDQPAS